MRVRESAVQRFGDHCHPAVPVIGPGGESVTVGPGLPTVTGDCRSAGPPVVPYTPAAGRAVASLRRGPAVINISGGGGGPSGADRTATLGPSESVTPARGRADPAPPRRPAAEPPIGLTAGSHRVARPAGGRLASGHGAPRGGAPYGPTGRAAACDSDGTSGAAPPGRAGRGHHSGATMRPGFYSVRSLLLY